MASSLDLRDLITQQAIAQGVPPSIALAVATQESGVNQNVVGSKGEVGTFQLMPSSFPGQSIGDAATNVQLGVGYLAQLYAKYGDWSTALAAYNWGPGNVDSGKSIPSVVWGYVQSILGMAGSSAATTVVAPAPVPSLDPSISSATVEGTVVGVSPSVWLVGGVLGVLGLAWWLAD